MRINNFQLTYCSNIHAGESWAEVFEALKINIPFVKQAVCPEKPFGIGLRLSNAATKELLSNNQIAYFKQWLYDNDCYVFTMNGFPYGGFHNTTVKDDVYKPDWTSNERLSYTSNLIKVLEQLIPKNTEAGISTSPLSYKPWIIDSCNTIDMYEAASINLIKCVVELHQIRATTGKYIHLDIEPEPDCLLENSKETIAFFNNYLIPFGINHLTVTLNVTPEIARKIITDHITVCYDVCHFAVEFENHALALNAFTNAGIKIGKVQISSALKVVLDDTQSYAHPDPEGRNRTNIEIDFEKNSAFAHPNPEERSRTNIEIDFEKNSAFAHPDHEGRSRTNSEIDFEKNSAFAHPDHEGSSRTNSEIDFEKNKRNGILKQYQSFAESTYLHQTIVKDKENKLHHFSDLPQALAHFYNEQFVEWRTHYHVPVFMKSYNQLQSTQEDIIEVLALLKQHQFTNHLEVETYTWEVLPLENRLPLNQSVVRELQWVVEQFKN